MEQINKDSIPNDSIPLDSIPNTSYRTIIPNGKLPAKTPVNKKTYWPYYAKKNEC